MGCVNIIKLGVFEIIMIFGGVNVSENFIVIFVFGEDFVQFEVLVVENFIFVDCIGGLFILMLVCMFDVLVLFDIGMFFVNNVVLMVLVGIVFEDVIYVVLIYMYGDYVSGLMQGGVFSFFNVQLIVLKVENDYWVVNVNDVYIIYVVLLIGNVCQIVDGDEIVFGIIVEVVYGYMFGYMIYLVESDGQWLLIIGDSFNYYVFLVQCLVWYVCFDIDKDVGVVIWQKVLVCLVEEKIFFIGYYMLFLVFGFIVLNGEVFFCFVLVIYQFV